jgi:hypothetical protein
MTGRPRGSRNKLGEVFITQLYTDWLEHGEAVIAAEFSRIDFHLPDRGRDWSGIEAPRCKFQDSNQPARFPHTLIVARTCGGNRSSMLMRR